MLKGALMIAHFFPKGFSQYQQLPVLGGLVDSFAAQLYQQGYSWSSGRQQLQMAGHICRYLERRWKTQVSELCEEDLRAGGVWFRRRFPNNGSDVRVLVRFLREHGLVKPARVAEPTGVYVSLNRFAAHLLDAHGYASSTIQRRLQIATEFLQWLKLDKAPHRIASLSIGDVERFIRHLGKRMGRVGLQKPIAALRHFLQFLSADGTVPKGLDSQIDTPRVYRQEKLPRALPWPIVEAFLQSIDRDHVMGKRDYAMFALMTTYGLRACDIVSLKLDDIRWRIRRIRVLQSKTAKPLELPLTDEVSSAIYDYLKRARRSGPFRQLFLRVKAPAGPLKPTGVIEAFQAWSRRSGLDIPYKGAHCLRHSYALHLLRSGESLKTIGDLLGHQSPESTAVYIRLATEDLREVPLHIPGSALPKEIQK
jgi:integrase/recombinase XerD